MNTHRLDLGWLLVCLALAPSTAWGQSSPPADSATPDGARGGAASADFDSLIDLITSTVAPDTWADNGGGDGNIRPFPSGVWLDAGEEVRTQTALVTKARTTPARPERPATSDPRRPALLRCVSLPRLEAEIARRSRAGEPLEEAMLTLAGLRRVERLLVIPPTAENETGDLILIGPAGDWRVDDDRRLVAADTGHAVVRLDDLLVLLRREHARPDRPLGCAITPRQERLAATQAYLDRTGGSPLAPGERDAWLEGMRSTLGAQDIEVFGLDPATNAARALVEADHHMKRLGLGAVGRIKEVPGYLDRVARAVRRGEAAQPMSVLRWWFAANYDAIERSADGLGFRLLGSGVRVLSENELLTLRGERVHTGESDGPTEGFARDFTEHFERLATEYPVYGELRNVFDLAVIASLIRSEGLLAKAGWASTLFLDESVLPTPRLRHARQVETMATCRVVRKRTILAAVSGGAWIEPGKLATSPGETLSAERPAGGNAGGWWWDATAVDPE